MRVGRYTLVNLVGLALPLVVAVLAIPPLLEALGADRFGLLTLIWAVVSYLGLFDLGLGRVLTQQLAIELANPRPSQVGTIVGTSMTLMLGLGVLAGSMLALGAEWGATVVKSVAAPAEVVSALLAMAVAMPAVIATSGLRGALEARHAFVVVNLIRLPMGAFTFLGPLAVVWWIEPRLDLIAWVLAAGRWVACIAHGVMVARVVPLKWTDLDFKAAHVPAMASTGGWLTLSNLVSPFMGYVDRFLIGVLVSSVAVAYYATPLEIAIKLSVVPAALTAVLFPLFAAHAASGTSQSRLLLRESVRLVLGILWPICMGMALFAHELLGWWISPEFASHSAPLLRIFSLGILVNSLAHVPLTLLQSAGAARNAAWIHLVELPLFMALLWWLTTMYGAHGAAAAWLCRMIGDASLMFWTASRVLRTQTQPLRQAGLLPLLGLVVASSSALMIESGPGRAAVLAAVVLVSVRVVLLPALRALPSRDVAPTSAMTGISHPNVAP